MNELIYLDYAATTPIDDQVIEEMVRCMGFRNNFGNPASRTHRYGQNAGFAVEKARQQVADLVGANSSEIIWTSGATESNNLALKGIVQQYKSQGKHIITSQIEHKSILDTCHELEIQGFDVTYLKPESQTGLITTEMVRNALRPDTILVSLMMVNNEIGTLTDVATIAHIVKANGSLFHVDAAQAVGKVSINLSKLPVDLMSFSGHKIYGPKGIGALYVRSTVQLKAQIHGGGHERKMRSGTLATHQIVGMGAASTLAKNKLVSEQNRLKLLRKKLWQGLRTLTPVQLNGHPAYHVANYLNVSFLGSQADTMIAAIQSVAAVSSGSACNSHQSSPSHVLTALDVPVNLANYTIRFSFGIHTTEQDIQSILNKVKDSVIQNFVSF
ncbi:aminotransferase class V-fold PLP-dependent enzyme [Acinetobacter guillouiae]|uniref:cysteine desulfurase n=1 Tax=Acinetobacter guillouiae TaxID=106649 RepID=A0A8X8GNV3_ACIGI|nr:aminotransferase class V-fold PLP-dependent enzyme [Acinetobacter guillouiae]MCF0263856.1 aminotransferase class V-fold PLP-dependent enzyme [Acinetobacter guillouiae]